MAITKVTSSVLSSGSATDGYVLTADGSGNSAWEAAAGGASSINDLTDAKTFGTGSIMLGDTTTGTLSNANYNVGVGVDMLNSLTSGYANIAIGFESCKDLTTGHNNVAVGHATLYENIGGEQNVAVGANALQNNTSGNYNTAVGKSALVSNTTQAGNTGVGWNALGDASSGLGRNTGMGYEANGSVTTGAANTAVGWASGGPTTGNGNTVMGYITTTGSTTAENRIVIGYNVTGSANNRVHLGSQSGYVYNDFTSNATWTQTSDERKKKDIVDDSLGLDFINDLRTTQYKFKAPSEFPKEWKSYNADITEPCDDKVHHGLIAQEVKQALDNAGVDSFEGWDELPDGTQQVSREMFVIPLIKAVQELSAQVEELKSRLGD